MIHLYMPTGQEEKGKLIQKMELASRVTAATQLLHPHAKGADCGDKVHVMVKPNEQPVNVRVTWEWTEVQSSPS